MRRKQEVWKSTWFVVLVVLALGAKSGKAAFVYHDVVLTMVPCYEYLYGHEDNVTTSCCEGAAELNDMVHSKSDLRLMCDYLRTLADRLKFVGARSRSLPQICQIQLPLPIDPNIDCARI